MAADKSNAVGMLEQYATILAAIATSFFGGLLWLVKRVWVYDRQIAVLENSLESQKEDLKEIRGDVKTLLSRITE